MHCGAKNAPLYFGIILSNRIKSHDSYGETHHSKCSVFAFDLETRIKTILPLISRLINKANHVSVGVSRRWCTGVVFVQPGLKVNDANYCNVLLLKQLLPDICQAAGDVCFQRTTRAQER